jgi:uncharacterized protein
LRALLAAVVLAGALLVAVLVVSNTRSRAAEAPIPPMPAQFVTDTAGALSSDTQTALNAQLADYNQKTGHQIIVWIGQTTGDTPLEDWTISAFTKWKVGRKGLDDGLALFLFMQDHKIRIEVGYGLEGTVTDARASQIARNIIAPKLKAGDPDGAVTDGVNALIAAIGGASPEQTGENQSTASNTSVADILVPLIFVFIFFVVVTVISRSARYASGRGYTIGSAGYGAGWWGGSSGGDFSGSGGGGGFSGGGGMGGGGGASASW